MGGATWINEDDSYIFETINGDINHCYTKHDNTLKLYQIHQAYHGKRHSSDSESDSEEKEKFKIKPIGRRKLPSELVEELEEKGHSVSQHDVSDLVGEHVYYWKKMESILGKMNFGD